MRVKIENNLTGLFFVGLLLTATLLASQLDNRGTRTPGSRLDYTDIGEGFAGRPLTPAEEALVDRALDSIATKGNIVYTNKNMVPCTLQSIDVAWYVWLQLKSGRIEAETLRTKSRGRDTRGSCKPDSLKGTEGDQANISDWLLREAMNDPNYFKVLMGVLVHEYDHKTQTAGTLRHYFPREIESYGAEYAFLCSIKVSNEDKEKEKTKNMRDKCIEWYGAGFLDPPPGEDYLTGPARDSTFRWYVLHDTGGTGTDSLISYEIGDTIQYAYSLMNLHGSDVFVDHNTPLLPLPNSIVLVTGGYLAPPTGVIKAFHIFNATVMGPIATIEVGPPLYLPAFFTSITYSEARHRFFVADTISNQILVMVDTNLDLIPDVVTGIYADALQPGFAPLLHMYGVDAGTHPTLGFGLTITREELHVPEDVYPYDLRWFLPDVNGDYVADACMEIPAFQFLTFLPVIQGSPLWAGETSVWVHATWNHSISIFATDSLGQLFFQQLGTVMMGGGVDAECPLLRPLLAGEYLLAVDWDGDLRLRRPAPVVQPVPQQLTVQPDETGLIHLCWEAVPGAEYYSLYASEDAVNFFDTGLISNTCEISYPIDLAQPRLFFRITARR